MDGTMSRTKRRLSKLASKPFPLLKLPPELRLQIYDFVFPDQVRKIEDCKGKLKIFRTCRLVYQEASDLFYGNRIFQIQIDAFAGSIDDRSVSLEFLGEKVDFRGMQSARALRCLHKIQMLRITFHPFWHCPSLCMVQDATTDLLRLLHPEMKVLDIEITRITSSALHIPGPGYALHNFFGGYVDFLFAPLRQWIRSKPDMSWSLTLRDDRSMRWELEPEAKDWSPSNYKEKILFPPSETEREQVPSWCNYFYRLRLLLAHLRLHGQYDDFISHMEDLSYARVHNDRDAWKRYHRRLKEKLSKAELNGKSLILACKEQCPKMEKVAILFVKLTRELNC